MDDDARTRRWLIVSVVGVVFLVLGLGYLHLSGGTSKKPPTVATPLLPVVSVCKEVAPGMSRIGARPGDRYMLQFDVPVKSVSVHEGGQDAPPFAYGFGLRPQAGGESFLEISYGPLSDWPDVDRKRSASKRIVKRTIVDDQGRSVGEDDWGYLEPERRWRRARFQGWVQGEYGFVNAKDAALFDEIIKSACLLPSPSS
jgi:hypothetical protein